MALSPLCLGTHPCIFLRIMESGEENLPQELETQKPLLYHHARPLEFVEFGIVRQKMGIDSDFEPVYKWLEEEVGFTPLFLAVGKQEENIRMTGYQGQFARLLERGKDYRRYRKKGEIDNQVLFSFSDVQNGVFTEFHDWHIALNAIPNGDKVGKWANKLIFRKTWDKEEWLDYADKKPHSVQVVVPELDLRTADSVWVRNKETQKKLQLLGFKHVEVKRIPAENQ